MMPADGNTLIRQLRRTLRAGVLECAPDEELLEQFVAERDEAAFAVLVRRHGPMVWSVCQRVLAHRQDAEDAFQATFLVLACKAAAIGRRKLLANWLFGVARRTALNVRAARARRARHEYLCGEPPEVGLTPEAPADDLRAIVDEELARMPEKYRLPLLMCGLEGMTHAEAGKYLGWPTGTVAGRLSRGRELLRVRLLRRGIAAPAAGLAAILLPAAASSAVPPLLAATAVRSALTFVLCGKSVTVAGTQTAAALTRAVLLKMCLARLGTTAAALAVLATSLGGAGAIWHWTSTLETPRSATASAGAQRAQAAQRGSSVPRLHSTALAMVDPSTIALPTDADAVVLRMDRCVDSCTGPTVALSIYADGRVVAEIPDGLDSLAASDLTQYAKESGQDPAVQQNKVVEGRISPSELEGLLRFALDEQEFFAFDPAAVKATIRAQYKSDGSVFDPDDATTTRFRVQTAHRRQEVRWSQLDKAAWEFPTVERLLQLHALDRRLSQVFYVLLAGGPEQVDAVVAKMNDLARSYYRRYPDVPPLTAADLFKVTPSTDGLRMTFTFSRYRDQLVRDPLFEVSIDVPRQGEPTLCYVMPPVTTFAQDAPCSCPNG